MNDASIHFLLERIKNLLHVSPYNPTILMVSPQFFHERGNSFIKFIVNNQLINLVAMDELHLSHHFGRPSRYQFKHIKKHVFEKLGLTPIITMTATYSNKIKVTNETLFGLKVTLFH